MGAGIQRRVGSDGTAHYRIRWLDHEGIRRSKSFPRESDAKRALALRQAEAAQIGAGIKAAPTADHTFAELAAHWEAHRLPDKRSADDDRSTIRRHLLPAFGPMRLREITRERLDAFRAHLQELRYERDRAGVTRTTTSAEGLALSPRTVRKVLTILGAMLRMGEDLGWLERAPRIRKPSAVSHKELRSWLRSRDEIARLLEAAAALDREDDEARERGQRVKGERALRTHPHGLLPLYATAVYMGMRLGELAALRWADVDLEKRRIRVWRSHDAETTKGGYERAVPIQAALLPILTAWKLRSPGPFVFPTTERTQRGPSDRVFRETFHATLERAGLPRRDAEGLPLVFHSLRHTWASHLAMSGKVDLHMLQRMGGWKDYATVQRYAHLLPERLDAAADVFAAAPPVERGAVVQLPAAAPTKRRGKG